MRRKFERTNAIKQILFRGNAFVLLYVCDSHPSVEAAITGILEPIVMNHACFSGCSGEPFVSCYRS